MLTPELKKLKETLEKSTEKTNNALLKELQDLNNNNMKSFSESLAISNLKCPTCGKYI